MASSNKLSVSELDFDQIKSNLVGFLQSQDQFSDYDFEGSSLSILMDLLSYNTHYNGFYANMIANEMFLDTAVFRESVVSRAAGLGYTPRSRKASVAYVDITLSAEAIDGEDYPSTITIEKWAKFKSSTGDGEYTFVTLEDKVLEYDSTNSDSTTWVYVAKNVDVYQGKIAEYSFTVQNPYSNKYSSARDEYVLPSSFIDIDTLEVSVNDSADVDDSTPFERATSLIGKDAYSAVYWLNETEDFKYELKFGDGVTFGLGIQQGNVINCTYLITDGPDANGCKSFIPSTYSVSSELEGTVLTCTPSEYISLKLDQNYVANFKIGEIVYGTESGATGRVISWDATTKYLVLTQTSGNFKYIKTSTGYVGEAINAPSGATGTITLVRNERSKSVSGSERESNDSIKLLAPLSYQSQDRCVTIKDYEYLIKNLFYQKVKSIKVWSGESMTEPQYGKVFIAIRPYTSQVLSASDKVEILNAIKAKNITSIQPSIVDADYIYVVPTISVKYNPSEFAVKGISIKDIVIQKVTNFASTYLNEFGTPFYFSDFIAYLDDSETSIVSVNVDIKMKKNFDLPLQSQSKGKVIKFSNQIKKSDNSENVNFSLESSTFTLLDGDNEIVDCRLAVDASNNKNLVVIDLEENIIKTDVGVIDYVTGEVTINDLVVSSTTTTNPNNPTLEGRIELFAKSIDNDVFGNENQIIDIQSSDIPSIVTSDIRNLVVA